MVFRRPDLFFVFLPYRLHMSLLASHTDNPTFLNASYILMGLALLIVLHYHLLPLLLSVILTYIFIRAPTASSSSSAAVFCRATRGCINRSMRTIST